jgi:ceramide glucosyltransferase
MLALGLQLLGTWAAHDHFRKTPAHLDAPFRLFPVSILKPLKGADSGLEENLRTFFELDYPLFELLFSVADPGDPALAIVRHLMDRYPEVKARVFVGQLEIGPNPKVNNLVQSYERASYDWILISDSNVRVGCDYLKRLVGHLEPGVGMVTSVIAGRDGQGVGGYLEAAFLNTFYARGMLLLAWWGRAPVVGKSMLFQRSVAERFGGIRILSRYLAEDYMAGEAMRRLNLRTVIATDPIQQNLGRMDCAAFWARHLRWGRIRKSQAPLPFAIEPLLGSLVSGLLGAFACNRFFDFSFSAVMGLHLATWSLCDLLLFRKLDPSPKFHLPLVWFTRELLSFPLWLHIAFGNTVQWRGNRLKVLSGGILDPVPGNE